MAAICETHGGATLEVTGTSRTLTQRFMIRNAVDFADAESALLAYTPATISGIGRAKYRFDQVPDVTGQVYSAEAVWSAEAEPLTLGETRIRYVGGSKTVRRLYDISTLEVQGDITSGDLNGAINVVEGQPEGVDVIVPSDSLIVERAVAAGTITFAYLAALRSIRGHVNNATWNSFAAGEVQFREVEAESSNKDLDKITYTFGIESNETSVPVGPYTFANKQGWDYISVGTFVKLDPANNIKVPLARWAALHRTHPRADFTTILGF